MDKKILFKDLNDELVKENIMLEIICVGGFVLEYYNLSMTQDIDAFYQEDQKIRDIIKKVGDKYGANKLSELWLNNSVANLNRIPPKSICEEMYSFSNLRVLMPPLIYILGMKLSSGRNKDRRDAGAILRLLRINSPRELSIQLSEYDFQLDMSMVLEIFEYAYGTDWLVEYLKEHPGEFRYY
ncbi:potassium transporter peripheral membrane component [Campylobacter jejuni]|nr:potassium transporter peripheral membrane component [Campylobacter jejuni]